jgi:hypothetical protein
MLHNAQENGQTWLARSLSDKLQETEHYATVIKQLLMRSVTSTNADAAPEQATYIDEADIKSTRETA